MTLTCQLIDNRAQWHAILLKFPTAHFLQSWEWAEFKQKTTGWHPERWAYYDEQQNLIAAVSILVRKVGPVQVMYSPKGPLVMQADLSHWQLVLDDLQKRARQKRAIWFKIDPDIEAGRGLPYGAEYTDEKRPNRLDVFGQSVLAELQKRNWRFSASQVQFRNTFLTDITLTEDELQAQMNQSTRRKIRQSDKKGVVIRTAHDEADLKALFNIYAITAQRQGFTIRPWTYYHDLWNGFWQADMAHILMAEVEDQIVGGVILFHLGERVWYFNGMSSNEYRNHQPNFGLQWTALQWAKDQGYKVYDWWGAPNKFSEEDNMWGVYRFKDGFGAELVRHIGAWDYIPFPPLYFAYEKIMPRVLKLLRRRASSNNLAD